MTNRELVEILLAPLRECARYKPAFGQESDAGVSLDEFRILYGQDPLYRWVGLDSELMYAAHKAAGAMTSIYRQLGIGCERLLRQIIMDRLVLSAKQVSWSYEYDKGDGKMATHTLDAKIVFQDIRDTAARQRMTEWVQNSAAELKLDSVVTKALEGAVFEIRQGYKSADSKRQQGDLRFGIRAYTDARLLPVIAIVSTQASDVVCRRYMSNRLLVLKGVLKGPNSTLDFFKRVIGFDLVAFFETESPEIRREFTTILQELLRP